MNDSPTGDGSGFPVGERIVIRRRGKKGIWTAEFNFNDEHCRRSLKTRNRRVAEQKALELESKLLRNELQPSLGPLLLDEALELYIRGKTADERAAKTLTAYTAEIRLLIAFAKSKSRRHVQQLDVPLALGYKENRKDEGELDAYSLYTRMIIVKGFTKWLRESGYIAVDPLRDLKVKEPPRRRHPAATLAQINAVLAAVVGGLLALLALLAMTGLRVGEAAALRREDVDLKEGFVHVRWTTAFRPKRPGSQRAVPIPRRLLALLIAYDQNHPLGKKRKFFFTPPPSHKFPDADHHINPRDTNEDFQDVCAALGYAVGRENCGLTLHALRRAFKSVALNNGVPQPLVDAWLGHEDESINRFYFRAEPDVHKQWIEKLPFGEADPAERGRLSTEPVRRKPGRRPKAKTPDQADKEQAA